MRKSFAVVVFTLFLAFGTIVSAQAPSYAPYGAWRGKIRYVQGPWRTRSTIHWSNGLTPIGGQVLMQGLVSAQDVLTDPNFVSSVLGTRDSERGDERDELGLAIQAIRAKNNDLRDSLNTTVLNKWGIPPTQFEPLVNDATGPNTQAEAASSTEDLFKTLVQQIAELRALGNTIGVKATDVVRYGEFLAGHSDELQLNQGQQQSLKRFNDFARKVVAVIGREPSTEEIAETPAEALGLYLSKLLDLTKACADAKIAAAKLKEVGEKLAPSIALPVVKDALTFAERVSRTADQWGEIPTVESDVFSPDSAAQPSPGLGAEGSPTVGPGDEADVEPDAALLPEPNP